MRLLIVDDEGLLCSALARGLGRTSVRVAVATSVTAALELLRAEPFDAVLADYHLGKGPSGLEFFSALAVLYPGVRRLLMSAMHVADGWQPLAETVLYKPFSIEELIRAVGAVPGRPPARPAERAAAS